MPYDVLKRPYDFPANWVSAIETAIKNPGKWFQMASKQTELEVLPAMRKMRLLRNSFEVFPLCYPMIRQALKQGTINFRRNPATHFQNRAGRANIVIEVCYRIPQDRMAILKNILEEDQ